MAYVRKTVDEFVIQGNFGYGHGWEDMASYDTRKEAVVDIKEYRESGIGVYQIVKRRVPKPPAPEPTRKLYEVHVWAGDEFKRHMCFSQADQDLKMLLVEQDARKQTAQDGIERSVTRHRRFVPLQ